MDVFKLSRDWFDFCFTNPEKIKPNHSALFFFCIEHCNRLGWKDKFGLPTTMAKEAIGISSYNTYISTLNDLVEWGFIILIEKSKNQHSSNIVALSKNDKAHDKALDRALIKHASKHSESTQQSIDSIDIQETRNKKQETINISFDDFYNAYDKKRGDIEKLKTKWEKLKDSERVAIMEYIPKYKLSQPDKKFRKDPSTFLNNKSWNDEIINSSNNEKYKTASKQGNYVRPSYDYTTD